jgi:hypothetical protein
MRQLLYCVFRPRQGQSPGPLQGVDGQPVRVAEYGGLAAAVSGCALALPEPAPPRVLAYAKVIEAFHRISPTAGAIPMRYGAIFEGESQVIRFLAERSRAHAALLREVEGREEMGFRLLLPTASTPAPHLETGPEMQAGPSGKTYLASRRARYAEEERVSGEMGLLAERCRCALGGLFDKCTVERRTVGDPRSQTPKALLSLCFLVPRVSLPHFRRRFEELRATLPTQPRLSGPWPPYNFVLPKTAPGGQASRTAKNTKA